MKLSCALIALCIIATAVFAGCVAAPDQKTPLVEYRRTGGIAGFNDHLTVFPNGTAFLSRRGDALTTFVMSPQDQDNLTRVFDSAGFASLGSEYPPASPGADYFDYVVTYRGKTVHAVDTGVPPALEPVLRALNEIVSAHAPP
jgi:hypothetical protein